MNGATDGSQLGSGIRAILEAALAKLAADGHIPSRGERRVTIALDESGRIRWFEANRVRVPASELGDG